LDHISLEEPHELREQTEGEIPRERFLAAIGRKQGDEIETLAERHGAVEKTIRNWLDRFGEEPIEQAPYDDPKPGRPSKFPELNPVECCWDRFDEVQTSSHPGSFHTQTEDSARAFDW